MESEPSMAEQVEDLLRELFPVATRAGKLSLYGGNVRLDLDGVVKIDFYTESESVFLEFGGHDAPDSVCEKATPLDRIRAFHELLMPVARALVAAAGPEVSDGK